MSIIFQVMAISSQKVKTTRNGNIVPSYLTNPSPKNHPYNHLKKNIFIISLEITNKKIIVFGNEYLFISTTFSLMNCFIFLKFKYYILNSHSAYQEIIKIIK
jgi:hypothetical protein